ncbi:Sulfotransferase [Hordeum vulgare]|nr:Sulfotransferase [Hordeum vulgare]
MPSRRPVGVSRLAPSRQTGGQTEADDVALKDAGEDEPAQYCSPVHDSMTIDEARANYMDMVREEQFHQAPANQAYNLQLLEGHHQAEEQLAVKRAIAPCTDVTELLESYRLAREICLKCSQYN